jgi:TonB family protein
MKNILLLLTFALFSLIGISQTTPETPLSFVQEMPTYAAGEDAFWQVIFDHLDYPEYEKSMNIEGTVFVNFVVEKDGTPTNFKITRGVVDGAGLDSAAINACRALGKFNPGTQAGVPQRVYLTIPVKFSLEDDEMPERLSKADLKEIKKDGKYICDVMFDLVEAQKANDQDKIEKLTAEFEVKAQALQKKYPEGSSREAELQKIIDPCMAEAMKAAIGN